jgi:hypothetical protein
MPSIPPDSYGPYVPDATPQRTRVRKPRHLLWLFAAIVVALGIGAYLFVVRSNDSGDTIDIAASQDAGTGKVSISFVYGEPRKSKAASGVVEIVMSQDGLVLLNRRFNVYDVNFSPLPPLGDPPTIGWDYVFDPRIDFDRTPTLGAIMVNVAFTPHGGQKLAKSTTFNYRPN